MEHGILLKFVSYYYNSCGLMLVNTHTRGEHYILCLSLSILSYVNMKLVKKNSHSSNTGKKKEI